MKKIALFVSSLFLTSCVFSSGPTSSTASVAEAPTTVELTVSNWSYYIKADRKTASNGVHSTTWYEFSGALQFAIYDATLSYKLGSVSETVKLDASGAGKTKGVDSVQTISVTSISGTVTYRL